MVVAPGAAQRQSEEGCAGDVDEVRQLILALHEGQVDVRTLDDVVGTGNKEPGAQLVSDGVSCDLLADEFVVGLVIVEALDDVIAVTPRAGSPPVGFEAVGFSETYDVEPVPRPALTVTITLERFFDQPLPGAGLLVRDEGLDFPGSGGKAVHDQAEPANKAGAVGAG